MIEADTGDAVVSPLMPLAAHYHGSRLRELFGASAALF